MAIAAAAQGQGVALASLAIAADDLASGRLVAPFATTVLTPFGYYFLCRPDAAETPRIVALRDFPGRGGGAIDRVTAPVSKACRCVDASVICGLRFDVEYGSAPRDCADALPKMRSAGSRTVISEGEQGRWAQSGASVA